MSRTIGQHVHVIRAAASHGSLSLDLSRALDLAAGELASLSRERDDLRKMAKDVRGLANRMCENPTLSPAGALIGRLLTKHGVAK